MGNNLKLRTNVPLVGKLNTVVYAKGKKGWEDPNTKEKKDLPDQIRLNGSWEGVAETTLYIPVAALGQLLDMGAVKQASDQDGVPTYRVIEGARRLAILKEELEGNKKRTTIRWADAQDPPAAAAPSTSAPAPRPPAAAPRQSDARQAKPTEAAAEIEKIRKQHRRRMAEIAETIGCALDAAKATFDSRLDAWKVDRGKLPTHVYMDAVLRIAAGINISADKEHLVVKRKDGAKAEPVSRALAPAGAAAMQAIGDPYTEPSHLQPVPEPEEEPEPGSREELDMFPGALEGEEDDLPF